MRPLAETSGDCLTDPLEGRFGIRPFGAKRQTVTTLDAKANHLHQALGGDRFAATIQIGNPDI